MKALVVGYGSIGARHARVLTNTGHAVAVVSQRDVEYSHAYSDLGAAMQHWHPDYVVISNPTYLHHAALLELAHFGFRGLVLVEKPLFESVQDIPRNDFSRVYVGYNLRFHPIIRELKSVAESESVISLHAYVGQYLPDWRPGSDYSASYSASTDKGGGVLRDLSHELDYITWMFGGWNRVAAIGGHYSPLNIQSEDVVSLLLETPRCPVVSVQLNYLDRMSRRSIIMNTAHHTYEADLIRGTIACDREVRPVLIERDVTYRDMHLSILSGESTIACALDEAFETLRLIDATNVAVDKKSWISR